MKIDVEGFEPDVLHGLDCALPALSFEIVPAVRAATIECINRLGQLGDYEFNLSFGERYQFDEPRWRSAPEIREQIVRLATGSGSGDVYARRLAGR